MTDVVAMLEGSILGGLAVVVSANHFLSWFADERQHLKMKLDGYEFHLSISGGPHSVHSIMYCSNIAGMVKAGFTVALSKYFLAHQFITDIMESCCPAIFVYLCGLRLSLVSAPTYVLSHKPKLHIKAVVL